MRTNLLEGSSVLCSQPASQTLYLLVRPALRLRFIALQFSIITLALMAMHNTAHAGGEILPQPVFWQSYNQYAFYPDQNQACLAEAQRESAFQGWAFISVDSCYLNPNDPNYLLGTFSFNARNVTHILQTRMVAGIARVTCPAHSSPSASSNITCNCSDGYFPDPSKTSCVPCLPPDVLNQQTGKCEPPETYVLSLSPETATIEPGQEFKFKAVVTRQDGGAPSKAVPVSVKVEVDPTSGGHEHGETVATRPKGSVAPATGNIVLPFTFTATQVSGTHTITATCDLCVNKTQTAKVDVKVDGLAPIPDGASFYTLVEADGTVIGATGNHNGNHYLTPEAATTLLYMAASYHTEITYWAKSLMGKKPVPPLPLHLNDASLVWGGKFDVSGRWTGEHAEHTRGTVIDIRANSKTGAIPPQNFAKFIELAEFYGADAGTGPHSFGLPNQHFHVRLLGNGE